MEPLALAGFLLSVALGAYVQTVTGFALGLIVMGGVTLLNLAPVHFTAIVIGLTALVNNFVALQWALHHIDRRGMLFTLLGMIPATYLGVLLLDHIQNTSIHSLRLLLGAVILSGGVLLALRPHPRKQRSAGWVDASAGVAGGLLAGLFSIGGPPLVFHFYRQPISLPSVRATLLATFFITTLARLFYVGAAGEITRPMLEVSLYCLPAVFFATLAGRRYPPPLPDIAMRRFAFVLLGLIGLFLLIF